MAFAPAFLTGLGAAGASGVGIGSSLAAAGSLIGTGTAAGIGAGLGMGVGTFGGVGSVLGGLGTLMSAGAARAEGKAAQAAANYNAEAAMMESRSRESAQRAEASRRLSTIRANIGKSGATTAGTPLMVLAESASNAEIDALNTQYSGIREAAVYRAQGTNARRAGNVRAGASLLSGFGRIL
jgi:hypothetical protein